MFQAIKKAYEKKKRSRVILDGRCKEVVQQYLDESLTTNNDLDLLITKINNDTRLLEIAERNVKAGGTYVLLEMKVTPWQPDGVNLNLTPEHRLHVFYFNYYDGLFERHRRVTTSADLQQEYPMTADDLRVTLCAYIINADRRISGDHRQ